MPVNNEHVTLSMLLCFLFDEVIRLPMLFSPHSPLMLLLLSVKEHINNIRLSVQMMHTNSDLLDIVM